MSERLKTSLIILVATVWAANFLAPLVVAGYTPPAEIHLAFMAIIGTLAASYRRDGDGGDSTRGTSA